MRSIFRRREPETFPDPLLPPLRVFEADDEDERPRERTEIDWSPKPDALTRWAELAAHEWTRPAPVVTPAEPKPEEPRGLPWSITPPTEAGVWWYCEADSERVAMCIVTEFGAGRLSVLDRVGDCCTYRSVGSLHRFWSGPVGIPEFVELDEVEPCVRT